MSVHLSSQLAGVGRNRSMLSVHPGGKIPRKLWIEAIRDHNLSGPVCSSLLEMIPIGDPIIIVARAACSFGAVRSAAIDAEGYSVQPPQFNLLMDKYLGES